MMMPTAEGNNKRAAEVRGGARISRGATVDNELKCTVLMDLQVCCVARFHEVYRIACSTSRHYSGGALRMAR